MLDPTATMQDFDQSSVPASAPNFVFDTSSYITPNKQFTVSLPSDVPDPVAIHIDFGARDIDVGTTSTQFNLSSNSSNIYPTLNLSNCNKITDESVSLLRGCHTLPIHQEPSVISQMPSSLTSSSITTDSSLCKTVTKMTCIQSVINNGKKMLDKIFSVSERIKPYVKKTMIIVAIAGYFIGSMHGTVRIPWEQTSNFPAWVHYSDNYWPRLIYTRFICSVSCGILTAFSFVLQPWTMLPYICRPLTTIKLISKGLITHGTFIF